MWRERPGKENWIRISTPACWPLTLSSRRFSSQYIGQHNCLPWRPVGFICLGGWILILHLSALQASHPQHGGSFSLAWDKASLSWDRGGGYSQEREGARPDRLQSSQVRLRWGSTPGKLGVVVLGSWSKQTLETGTVGCFCFSGVTFNGMQGVWGSGWAL